VRIDDILAALLLSLAMMRRIAVRTARADDHPNVPRADFERWRSLALKAFDLIAVGSLLKVVLNQAWVALALTSAIGAPWFQLGGLLFTLGWIVSLVWGWKIATDARVRRLELGIELKRERPVARP
jgi:hypothetical protein